MKRIELMDIVEKKKQEWRWWEGSQSLLILDIYIRHVSIYTMYQLAI